MCPMKKATDASPNRALRYERELRCWSQVEVADHIGTTAFNVSRWERGITFPGSYFRQQLCGLFEKSPQELGFLNTERQTLEQNVSSDQNTQMQISAFVLEESERHEPHQDVLPAPPASVSHTMQAPGQTAPLIWNVPYRRNPFFTGRAETLHALHEVLHAGNTAVRQAVAISGLGGIVRREVT